MRRIFILVIAMASAFFLGRWMVTNGNPEVEFWAELSEVRDYELSEIRSNGGGVILFAGGSSCAFSVDPVIIKEETGRSAYNLGGVAGAGSRYLIDQAMRRAEAGDLLILALEPHFLREDRREKSTQLGMALSAHSGELSQAAGGETFSGEVTCREYLRSMRPGARYFSTWMGKLMAGGVTYRYTMKDRRCGGRLETAIRKDHYYSEPILSSSLTAEAVMMLETTCEVAARKGVLIAYSLPWSYTNIEYVDHNREANRLLVEEVSEIMPVLSDTDFGACPEQAYFADSEYHLTAAGSEARSRAIARGIQELNLADMSERK